MVVKKPFIINVKDLTSNIDEYIKEFYTNPIKKFKIKDEKKISIVSNIINNIVKKRSIKYEITKYNKIIVKDVKNGLGCVGNKYKIKSPFGNETSFSTKTFLTNDNKLIIIKEVYFLDKNTISDTYNLINENYKIMEKLNASPKLLDNYVCSDNDYNYIYIISVLEYDNDYIPLKEYINDSKIKTSDIEKIQKKLYDMILNLNKNNLLLNEWYNIEDIIISKKNKDMKFIIVKSFINQNDIIDKKLKSIKKNLKWIINKKEQDDILNISDNVDVYVSKRLLDDNIVKIAL